MGGGGQALKVGPNAGCWFQEKSPGRVPWVMPLEALES